MIRSKFTELLRNYATPLYPWLALIIASLLLLFYIICIFGFTAQLSQLELPLQLFLFCFVLLADKGSHFPSAHSTWVIRIGLKYRLGSSEGNFGFTYMPQMSSPHNNDNSHWWVHLNLFLEVYCLHTIWIRGIYGFLFICSFACLFSGVCSDIRFLYYFPSI